MWAGRKAGLISLVFLISCASPKIERRNFFLEIEPSPEPTTRYDGCMSRCVPRIFDRVKDHRTLEEVQIRCDKESLCGHLRKFYE